MTGEKTKGIHLSNPIFSPVTGETQRGHENMIQNIRRNNRNPKVKR